MYEEAREDVLLFFLTEFSTKHPVAYVESVVRKHLGKMWNDETVEDFWLKMGAHISQDLMEEFNVRSESGLPLRYELIDDIGTKVKGRESCDEEVLQAAFQGALDRMSHTQFEQLSARLLQLAGCTAFWFTPASHDEGLDAFGLMPLQLPPSSDADADAPVIAMLAQAKHYISEKVRTGHIRELAGSGFLAKFHTYSSATDKYAELDMRPLAPVVFFMVSSGEVSRLARGLARRAGMYLMTSRDIFTLLRWHWERNGVGLPTSMGRMSALLRRELKGIPVAS